MFADTSFWIMFVLSLASYATGYFFGDTVTLPQGLRNMYKVLVTTYANAAAGTSVALALTTEVLEFSDAKMARDAAHIVNNRAPLAGSVENAYFQRATLLFKDMAGVTNIKDIAG